MANGGSNMNNFCLPSSGVVPCLCVLNHCCVRFLTNMMCNSNIQICLHTDGFYKLSPVEPYVPQSMQEGYLSSGCITCALNYRSAVVSERVRDMYHNWLV